MAIRLHPCLLAYTLAACSASSAPPMAPVAERSASASPAERPARERIDAELSVRRVARDAYVITHEPFHASNVLVVRMDDGTLVICSSPFETEGTRAMLKWLRAELRPSRMIAINTHFHLDGTGGNEAYREAGVEIYASRHTQELLEQRGARVRDGAADDFDEPAMRDRVARVPMVPAGRTFPPEQGLTLTFGGEEVRVIHPGPAHSPDNVVVHFPARGVLFGGCMIKTGSEIGYTGDADIGRWEAAIHAIEPLAPRVVVPGHGDPGGAELLDNTIAVVRAAQTKR